MLKPLDFLRSLDCMWFTDIFDVFLQIWEAKLSENLGRCQLADSIYSPHSCKYSSFVNRHAECVTM